MNVNIIKVTGETKLALKHALFIALEDTTIRSAVNQDNVLYVNRPGDSGFFTPVRADLLADLVYDWLENADYDYSGQFSDVWYHRGWHLLSNGLSLTIEPAFTEYHK